jgi:hypothetical protein
VTRDIDLLKLRGIVSNISSDDVELLINDRVWSSHIQKCTYELQAVYSHIFLFSRRV